MLAPVITVLSAPAHDSRSTSESQLDSSSSFFGSFVSVFVNPQLQAADRVLRLQLGASFSFWRSFYVW